MHRYLYIEYGVQQNKFLRNSSLFARERNRITQIFRTKGVVGTLLSYCVGNIERVNLGLRRKLESDYKV